MGDITLPCIFEDLALCRRPPLEDLGRGMWICSKFFPQTHTQTKTHTQEKYMTDHDGWSWCKFLSNWLEPMWTFRARVLVGLGGSGRNFRGSHISARSCKNSRWKKEAFWCVKTCWFFRARIRKFVAWHTERKHGQLLPLKRVSSFLFEYVWKGNGVASGGKLLLFVFCRLWFLQDICLKVMNLSNEKKAVLPSSHRHPSRLD